MQFDNFHCLCQKPKQRCDICRDRDFLNESGKLCSLLNEIKDKTLNCPIKSTLENEEERKYKDYNYNGSFHKTLEHDANGLLIDTANYRKLVKAIVKNDQEKLLSIPLAVGSTIRLGNPTGSLATVLIGAMQSVLRLEPPPSLSSLSGAADMVELYAEAIARDVAFIDYASDPKIQSLLQADRLNDINVIEHLRYSPLYTFYYGCVPKIRKSLVFTPQNIFRSPAYGCLNGPYISQFLLLDFTTGALNVSQLYLVQPTLVRAQLGGFRVEWGINSDETVKMQNGRIDLLSPTPPLELVFKRIYSGRALAETVHNDPPYQFFYQAVAILQGLAVKPNPGWIPLVYPNQGFFVTANGIANIYDRVADVTQYALLHTWYWKWQQYRKLRPEVFALWINNVKNEILENENNFDIAEFIFGNGVLDDINALNKSWIPGPSPDSYTLPQTYREGAPTHPSYNSGHGIIAGACVTLLKIFYDGEQRWLDVPGVRDGRLSGGIKNAVFEAETSGDNLVTYSGDTINITVGSELNKLADHVGTGRCFSGIHYRSDIQTSLILGEEVAINYMEDILSTMVENNINGTAPKITFRRFNGTLTTVKPRLCTKTNCSV